MNNNVIDLIIPKTAKGTEEELESRWFELLSMDYADKVEQYKSLIKGFESVLPKNPLVIFNEYFKNLEIATQKKFKKTPTSIRKTISSFNGEVILMEFNNVDLEIRPWFYQFNGYMLRFPVPEIPNSFFLNWISIKIKELKGLGFNPEQQKPEISHSIPSNRVSISKTSKPIRNDLRQQFYFKNRNDKEFEEILDKLHRKGLLSECKTRWIGLDQNGIIQLASLIRWIGIDKLKIRFTQKEIKNIALNNFGTVISLGSVKKSKAENGEYYLTN